MFHAIISYNGSVRGYHHLGFLVHTFGKVLILLLKLVSNFKTRMLELSFKVLNCFFFRGSKTNGY